jgi:hypothetical protein
MFALGRMLQLGGLLILPVAIAGEVLQRLDLKQSLTLSGLGILLFSAGWLLQQSARPR